MKTWRKWYTAFLLSLGISLPASAIINGHPPDNNDLRYDAVGAFAVTWRLGVDYSGERHSDAGDNAWYCTAVLINPSVILTARHCVDGYLSYGSQAPYAVRFRRQTDGSLGTIEQGVNSFYHAFIAPGSWIFPAYKDIAVGILVSPVNHIAPIAQTDLQNVEAGQHMILAGWGREGPGYGQGEARQLLLCQNEIISQIENGWMRFWEYDQNWIGACGINNWDSGSPILIESEEGILSIIGIANTTSSGWRVPL